MSLRMGHRWRQKPPLGVPIDLAHPDAQGLILAFSPHSAAGIDLTGQHAFSVDSPGVVPVPGQNGTAMRFNTFGGQTLSNSTLLLPTLSATVLLIVRAFSVPTNDGSTFGDVTGTNPTRFQAHIAYGGDVAWDFGGFSAPNRSTYTPDASFFGAWHRMAFRAGTLGSSIWTDGVRKANQTTAITRTASAPGFTIGKWTTFAQRSDVESLLVFNRELTDAEILAWTEEPYRMWSLPSTRRLWMPVSSPPPPPSLDSSCLFMSW